MATAGSEYLSPTVCPRYTVGENKVGHVASEVARLAYKAGADYQLYRCVVWLRGEQPGWAHRMQAFERPKPPTLKEEAMRLWQICERPLTPEEYTTVRLAIESIPDS